MAKTYLDVYNDIHDLVKYESDGIKSSTAKESDMEESDASRSSRSSRSSNAHSSRRNAQIAAAANHIAQQQVAANTVANANLLYQQQQSPGAQARSPTNPGPGPQQPCKNCKSTKHGTKYCTSTKCFEPNCGKTFATADERKSHYVQEHGANLRKPHKPAAPGKKSPFKGSKPKQSVKFANVNRVQADIDGEDDESCIDSEVSSDSSMSVERPPKSIAWKGKPKARKVSKIRAVSTIHRTTKVEPPAADGTGTEGTGTAAAEPAAAAATANDDSDGEPPGLCDDSSDDEAPAEDEVAEEVQPEPSVQAQAKPPASSGTVRRCWKSHPGMPEDPTLHDGESEDEPPALCEDDSSSDDDSESEPIVEALPQPEPEAQAKPSAKRERPPMAKHTPIFTRGIKAAMHNYFGWEPKYDNESGFPTRKTYRREMREVHRRREQEMRTIHPCDSEDPPVKGPPSVPAQEGTSEPEPTASPSSSQIGSEPGWRKSLSTDSSYFTEEWPDDQEDERNLEERNLDYPKYSVDEFMNLRQTHSVYIRYRIAGGKMKWKETDTGDEELYKQWPGIELIDGEWCDDYNNIAPCEWTNSNPDYVRWYQSTHPKPIDVREATRNWLDRREQLKRHLRCAPGSYEAYLHDKNRIDAFNPHTSDTWDNGKLWRMHMTRKQAALEMTTSTLDNGIYVNEQDIDDRLIRQDRQLNDDDRPEPTRKPPPAPSVRTEHTERDWDFFYRSLLAPPETRVGILSTMISSQQPGTKSSLRTQKATTLSERISNKQQALRTKAANKQRTVNAIVDTGAQVTTMPESAVSRMPAAHNHRDAPPGTAVKYGNGEIETIERLVDIGHYEVQVTPDNCSASLISVDQIVQDGHTVTFSATETIIADDANRYNLAYPRVPNSREWTIPMRAMEEISKLRQDHPQHKTRA